MALVGCYPGYRTWHSQRPIQVYTRYVSGTHLLYVVAAPLGRTADSHLANLIRSGRDSAQAVATRNGMPFGTIGISPEWRISNGLKSLNKIGPFDEVIVGRNWFNHGIAEYANLSPIA